MNEVTGLLEESMAALARLDGAALVALEGRALRLHGFELQGADVAETNARLRVFASVLRETDRGLRTLRRVRGEGDSWAR